MKPQRIIYDVLTYVVDAIWAVIFISCNLMKQPANYKQFVVSLYSWKNAKEDVH